MAIFFTFCIACNIGFSQGSWIVKQSVGKKACLVGQALETHYFRGKNYLEVSWTDNHVFASNSSLSLSLSLFLHNNLLSHMVYNLLESFCNDVFWLVVMWWNANLALYLKPASNRCWVFNSGKGGGQSCSWIPKQFGHRNGILNTGKTTKLSQQFICTHTHTHIHSYIWYICTDR